MDVFLDKNTQNLDMPIADPRNDLNLIYMLSQQPYGLILILSLIHGAILVDSAGGSNIVFTQC